MSVIEFKKRPANIDGVTISINGGPALPLLIVAWPEDDAQQIESEEHIKGDLLAGEVVVCEKG
jgi:hypothetical protein